MLLMNKYVILPLVGFMLFSSCGGDATKSGCDSVNSCLAIYDFEGARHLIDREDYGWEKEFREVTIAESKYWAEKGEIDKALSVIDESWGVSESDWPEEDWQQWRYNIIEKGVTSCCEKGNYSQAKIYALKAPDDLNIDGQKIGSSSGRWEDKKGNTYDSQGVCEYDGVKPCSEIKAKGPSMREELLKKIAQFEELLK
jgi:hypothetical protein